MADRGVILAVDDEEPLLDLMTEYLTRLGFGVRGFASPVDAVEAFRKSPGGFAVVLLDLHMPGLRGDDAVVKLRTCDPGVRIVLLSGYPRHAVALADDPSGRTRYLQKPFAAAELAAVIDSVLGS